MIFNMIGSNGPSMKSTIIVSISTGSTVGAYTDAACTTLVKTATEKGEGEFWITGLDNGLYYIKATKNTDESIVSYTINEFGVYRISMTYNVIPEFTYTGSYQIVNDSDTPITTSSDNWKIRFLTSGTLNFSRLNGATNGIDVFLVGGGGNGAKSWTSGAYVYAGGGGAGGFTKTESGIQVATGTNYNVIIGDATGQSSFNSISVNGGGSASTGTGGSGGSGGGNANGTTTGRAGASDGNNATYGGTGQGTTTREFGELNGTLYAGGGSGGSYLTGSITAGADGGGGDGGNRDTPPKSGTANTGGGGGGSYTGTQALGGSGIVIIRNAR